MSRVIGALLVAGMLCADCFLSGSCDSFINLPGLLFVFNCTLGGLIFAFGCALPCKALYAVFFSPPSPVSTQELERYQIVFKAGSGFSLAGGWLFFLQGLYAVLSNTGLTSDALPCALGIPMVPLLYGVLLSQFVFRPLRYVIFSRYGEKDEA